MISWQILTNYQLSVKSHAYILIILVAVYWAASMAQYLINCKSFEILEVKNSRTSLNGLFHSV